MSMQIESPGALDNLQAGLEVSHVELKKQTEQAKRFANADIKNHPRLGDIKGALKVLQPEQLLNVLKNTRSAMNGSGGTTEVDKQDIPDLIAPRNGDTGAAKSTSTTSRPVAAEMTGLLARITQLTNDSSLQNMISRMQGFNAMMSGASNAYSSLAKALEEQGKEWANSADAVNEAQKQANALAQNVSKAKSDLADARNTLNELEAEAANQNPVSPELQAKIDTAKAAVAAAQANLIQTSRVCEDFITTTLNPAIAAEKSARSALDETRAQAKSTVASFTPQQNSAIEQRRKQSDQEAKSLTFLIALMSQLLNKSSSDDLKATAELKQKLSEAAARDAEKKGQEYEAKVREAEEMQKTMGCVGKVLGWVITAVSVAAAAFTGGASLALAAVGLALAIGDEISQAVTGHSFIQEALQPLMENIVKPLMEALGKMFADILEGMGVDKESAAMAGQIMGAIAAAVVLVAGVLVAGSVISKAVGAVVEASKTATRSTMQRLMNSAAGKAFKRISQGMGRSMGVDDIKMMKISNYSQMAQTGAEFVNTSIGAVGDIITASKRVDAAKVKSAMIKDAALQDLLNEMMSRAVDVFSRRIETVNGIVKSISVIAENQLQAGKYISRQMSKIAG